MASLVLPSGFSASGSSENLSGSEPHWERMDFQADSEPMEFYGHVAAFLMILGFRLFWLGGLETWLPGTLKKIILWIGEYSMGIFLTHWLGVGQLLLLVLQHLF